MHREGRCPVSDRGSLATALAGLFLACSVFSSIVTPPVIASPPARLTPDLHLQMARVGSPVPSPDGSRIAYTVSELAPSGDERETQIWLLDPGTGDTRQLTRGPSASSPSWGPGGRSLYFLREGQVWRLPFQGGEAEQVTDLPLDVSGYLPNPDPDAPPRLRLVVSLRVHPECPEADWVCTERARDRWNSRPALVSELFPLRHWSSWRDSLRSHLFIGDPHENVWTDLTPGWAGCPPMALAGGAPFLFSPDGTQIVFSRNLDHDEALSTNNDLFLIDLDRVVVPPGAGRDPQTIAAATTLLSKGLSGGGGNDDQPCFSPDGRHVAFTSMERAGYESDLRRIMIHDRQTGQERCLTCSLDRSAGSLTWSPNGRLLYFTAYDREATGLYRIEIENNRIERLLHAGSIGGLETLPDGRLLLLLDSSRMPGEIFLCDPDLLPREPDRWKVDLAVAADGRFGSPEGGESSDPAIRQLTFHNWERLRRLEMSPVEHFWFVGARGDSVHGFLLRPPGIRPQRKNNGSSKLPLVLVLHGGPQWAYHDFWLDSYNFQMIAAAGFATATINFHGSAGFGITFQDEIREHWGDIPGEDVLRGLDHIFAHYEEIDSARVAAIGRSFGGYLVNWLNGTTNRFRCLVSHSGSFNEVAGWGTTEELWFPEWEMGGTPWERPDTYWSNSPMAHAVRMRTPTLIIHGQKDFRVDLSDGLQTYTTLRRQGVPARFVTFPDQGHHIDDPEAWRLMWQEIFAWLRKHME